MPQEAPPASPPGRILIVEDNAVIALAFSMRLELLGFDVVGVCAGAEEALNLVEEHDPDVALLDISLEGELDGLHVARSLQPGQAACVFLTASSSEPTLRRVRDLEPAGVLFKPVDERLLRVTLDNAVHARRARRLRTIAASDASGRDARGSGRALAQAARLSLPIFESLPVGLCYLDRDLRYQAVNEFLAALNGLPVAEHLGRTLAEVVPAIAEHVEPLFRALFETGEPILDGIVKAETPAEPGVERIFKHSYYPVRDAGEVVGASCIIIDVTARHRAEEAQSRSARELQEFAAHHEQRALELERVNESLRHEIGRRRAFEQELSSQRRRQERIIDNLFAIVGIWDLEGRLDEVHASPRLAAGRSLADMVGKHISELDWWSHAESEPEKLIAALALAATGESGRFDVVIRADDEERTVDFMLTPLRGSDGLVTEVIGCGVDVTERRRVERRLRKSLDEKKALLREVHHRVKNNLQVIASLLYMQSLQSEDDLLADALHQTRNRVAAMALAHESLYRSDDLGRIDLADYLRDLVQHLTAALRPEGMDVDITVEFESIFTDIERATPCGLILNELLTNAFKHGLSAQCATKQRVSVNLQQGAETVQLTVSDSGPGRRKLDNGDEGRLGLKLVKVLSKQLRGEFLVPDPGESTYTLRFVP